MQYLLKKPEYTGFDIPMDIIEKGDSVALEKYLKGKLGLDSLNIGDLRDRAAILRISPIFGLSKGELIIRIRDRESENLKHSTNKLQDQVN